MMTSSGHSEAPTGSTDDWLSEERRRVAERVWDEAYSQGIADERTASELQVGSEFGLGYYGAARRNPYLPGGSGVERLRH